MNELYKEKKSTGNRRRWIYVLSVLIMASAIFYLFFPNPGEVRVAMVINPDANMELELKVLPDCALKNIYLRASLQAPATGDVCTLTINGNEIKISDLGDLPKIGGEEKTDYINLALPYDLQQLSEAEVINIAYCNVSNLIERYDLELVVEVMGAPESVRNWNEFISLRAAEGMQLIVVELDQKNDAPDAAPAKNENAGENSEEVSPAA